jgi:hypothetical protein
MKQRGFYIILASVWPDEFVKKSSKIEPNPFLLNVMQNPNHGKSSTKMWAISVIFNELPKVNNPKFGENSSNLVTLSGFLCMRNFYSIEPRSACRIIMCKNELWLWSAKDVGRKNVFSGW